MLHPFRGGVTGSIDSAYNLAFPSLEHCIHIQFTHLGMMQYSEVKCRIFGRKTGKHQQSFRLSIVRVCPACKILSFCRSFKPGIAARCPCRTIFRIIRHIKDWSTMNLISVERFFERQIVRSAEHFFCKTNHRVDAKFISACDREIFYCERRVRRHVISTARGISEFPDYLPFIVFILTAKIILSASGANIASIHAGFWFHPRQDNSHIVIGRCRDKRRNGCRNIFAGKYRYSWRESIFITSRGINLYIVEALQCL